MNRISQILPFFAAGIVLFLFFAACLVQGTFIAEKIFVTVHGPSPELLRAVSAARTNLAGREMPLCVNNDSLCDEKNHGWARAIIVVIPDSAINAVSLIEIRIGDRRYALQGSQIPGRSQVFGRSVRLVNLGGQIQPPPGFLFVRCPVNFTWKARYVLYCLVAAGIMLWLIAQVAANVRYGSSPAANPGKVDWVNAASLFLVTGLVTMLFAPLGVDYHHDGIMLKPALDVLEHKVLFRDTFSFYGAFTVYLHAMSLALFGKSLLSLRIVTALFYAAAAPLLYLIFAEFLKKWQAVLSVALWLLLMPFLWKQDMTTTLLPWNSVYALVFGLAALFLCVRSVRKRNWTLLVAAGASVGVAFFFRQQVGVLLLAGLCLGVGVTSFVSPAGGTQRSLRDMGFFCLGALAVAGAVAVPLALTGSLKDWYLQSIKLAYAWAERGMGNTGPLAVAGALFNVQTQFTSSWLWRILPCVTLLMAGYASVMLIQRRPAVQEHAVLFLVAVAGLFSWPQYFPVACHNHMFWAATLMIGVTLRFFDLAADALKQRRRGLILFAAITVSLYGYDVFVRATTGFKRAALRYDKWSVVQSPAVLKGMVLDDATESAYQTLDAMINGYLKCHAGTPVLNLSRHALFSALVADGTVRHPYMFNAGYSAGAIFPDYFEKAAVIILGERPLLIMPDGDYAGRQLVEPVIRKCNYQELAQPGPFSCSPRRLFGIIIMIPSDSQ